MEDRESLETTGRGGPSVLLVDGDRDTSLARAKGIQRLGWTVAIARDGVQAMSLARRDRPDVIVLNMDLPAGGGLATLQRLRRNVNTTFIPVIAMVPGGDAGAAGASLRDAGAQACLEPASTIEDVCRAVGALLELPEAPPPARAPDDTIRDPARLEALAATGLLDAPEDPALKALTELAADLLGVPVALLSLVDGDRQFFATQLGLPEPWATDRETPLSHSFCQWVVSGREAVLVDDARDHPVLQQNRAVHEIGVVAYAGVPMSAPSGDYIGSFCGIDTQPHEWSDRDRAILCDLVEVAESLVLLELAAEGEPGDWGPWDTDASLRVITRGIAAVTRSLRRPGRPLKLLQRELLLSTLDRLSATLSLMIYHRSSGVAV